jgi:hypothetical protein
VTVIGVEPLATLFKQPGIRFPAIVKVTLPATEAEALTVTDVLLLIESATVSPTEICTPELLVIVREVTLLS